MSNRKDLERRFETLAADGDDDGDRGFFPQSKYTPEDFRNGDFDPADPFTPFTREEAADVVELYDRDETPEEVRQQSIELAIDRLENPEDHPAPREMELTKEEKDRLAKMFDVVPATATSAETRGGQ